MDPNRAGPVVLDTLSKACSQQADVLKPAEQQLHHWETQPGFYSILATIFCKHEIDVNVRWLAALYCKNGVERYWRKTAPNAMSEEEKSAIRKQLLSNFNEPVPQVALQVAVLVAKVARVDCPRNWPELIPTMLEAVRCDDQLIQERALLVLHHVTKTLASRRLPSDKKVFESLTHEVFGFILNLWNSNLAHFLQLASVHDEGMSTALDRCSLVLKILRKQIGYGFRDLETHPDSVSFLRSLFPHLEAMLDCRRSLWGHHAIVDKCEHVIVTQTKVLLDILEMHASSFVSFLKTTLEFVVRYNFTEKGLLFERFAVNCFNVMKAILFSDTYKLSKNTQIESSSAVSTEAQKILTEFFTFDTLSEICRRLVTQYFLLTTDDLTTWDADPEDFCQDEGGDSYKYSLRPCTEVLFLTIFKAFRLSLTPVLLELVRFIQAPCDPEDFATVLKKDAVYNAIGLAAFDLFDEIDFDQWYTTSLLQELQVKDVNYRIVRKRVIWLVGQWVGVKMSVSLRPSLYEAIISLLDKQEDLAVRLEAAACLKTTIDDFEFKTDQLLPYVEPLFHLLFELLKEVRECDTKMHVLHVFSFVIERMGREIRPYTAALVEYLPLLWQESSHHNMLRCSILTTLIHLVQSFGSACTNFYDFLIPVIELSTDITQDPHVYLMEDGLDLWLITLHYSPTVTENLLKLFTNIPPVLDLGTENLRVCLKLIEAYLLLCPQEFMQLYSSILAVSLSSMITNLQTDGQLLVLRVIELVFKVFPTEGPQVFSCFLPAMWKNLVDDEDSTPVISLYLCLFARILLQHRDFLWSFLEKTASDTSKSFNQLLSLLLDTWLDKIDSVTQPDRRKVIAMAVASLLTTNSSTMLERFPTIINLCVEVLHDVCRPGDLQSQIDSLVITDDEIVEVESREELEHDKRKRMLARKDPVHTVSLKDYVMSQLKQCQQAHGQAVFGRLMDQVDPDILSQLQQFSV
ncbi:importin-11-like isoform X2 [Gigantopelta aegis]|uniref:importin-11-like isoform X2 n=1 Tax=Gigantopelta aegis TaxID=1735272 RepID=UPI001B88DC83|nr:importin-11-like isoform X2 [Gigantopelta aegis]